MVNDISAINNSYRNYSAYNDDFRAKPLLNNKALQDSLLNSNTNLNLTNDTVSFKGKDSVDKTSSKENSGAGTMVIGAGLVIGAFIVGRNWKAIKGYITKLFNGKIATKAKTPLEKAKTKAWEMIQPNKNAKIKGTSVTPTAKPFTNTQEAKIIQNIGTENVSNSSRKLVEQHLDDVVTPEMQAAYDKSIAYKPLTQKQKQAKAALTAKNKAQKAELNSIANNSKGTEALQSVANATQKAEAAAAAIEDGGHINPVNKNIYFTKDGIVTQIQTAVPNSKGEYIITDPKKIAKHLAKNNINLSEFAG